MQSICTPRSSCVLGAPGEEGEDGTTRVLTKHSGWSHRLASRVIQASIQFITCGARRVGGRDLRGKVGTLLFFFFASSSVWYRKEALSRMQRSRIQAGALLESTAGCPRKLLTCMGG